MKHHLFGYSVEGPLHLALKAEVTQYLVAKGYKVSLEKPVQIADCWYIPDIEAKKETELLAVECGFCKDSKLELLRTYYPLVLHIRNSKEVLNCLANI